MTLSSGFRLGPYEILTPLGAGGMGEVYRARDTRLERTVAIKILPQDRTATPEVRQRFEREAKTVSRLTHPHICALFDVGREGETDYLVMELLEGEVLSERLARGPLPLEQTLRYGAEIAEALDTAHRQGIVHRDLKPGNVMLVKTGVKLLDFGLAKANAPAAPAGHLTALPTQQGLTQEGAIVGTFQYMAPEQLEGKEVDARTDIFALGATLYEMATGKRAFAASSQASLITAIMSAEPPPISSLNPVSPPALDRLVRMCMAKNPDDRWQSAHDVASQLRFIAEGSGAAFPAPVAARARVRNLLAWGVAAACALGMLALAIALAIRPVPPAARSVRFEVPLAGAIGGTTDLAISPDGTRLAFVAPTQDSASALCIRPLDSLEARPLPGTEGAQQPFWSPDGRLLAFFASGSLMTVDVVSGVTKTLCEAGADPRGGAWGEDGTILFATSFQGPLLRIPAGGGSPAPATVLDAASKEQTHRWPSFLPGGRRFLYFASGGTGEEPGEIFVGSLDGQPPTHIMTSPSQAVYSPAGYLLFDNGRSLVAQSFDPNGLKLSGDPVPLGGPLVRNLDVSGQRSISVSRNGVLVFQAGAVARFGRLVMLDRSGKELAALAEGGYYAPRLSRDGARLAVTMWDTNNTKGDIWIFDLARQVSSRLTFNPADDAVGTWTPDGQHLIFGSSREGAVNLYMARTDRPGSEEPLLRSDSFKTPESVSSDGRFLLYAMSEPDGSRLIALWSLPLSGDRQPRRFSAGANGIASAQFSPNGRWVAYQSVESGREEVYVSAFPGPGGKWQVSTNGGRWPCWRADGRELFFQGPDNTLMSAEVTTEPAFEARAPRPLFKVHLVGGPDRQYDVAPDGKRFVANVGAEVGAPPATIVLDWTAGLAKP